VPEPVAAYGLSQPWNPSAHHENNIAKIIATARGQLTTFTRQLDRICQTVQPEGQNLDAYGRDIRNLLILTCTEAETHWRNVLVANSSGTPNEHYTTADYVKLREPMKLNVWQGALPRRRRDFMPFDGRSL
jgi:hypothetical protein